MSTAKKALPKLEDVAAPLVLAKQKPAKVDAGTAAFVPWLDKHAGPELKAWNAFAAKHALRPTYRGEFSVAEAFSFSQAVAGFDDDGCWVARVRSVFCGVSSILEEDEEMYLATWWSTPSGQSLVYFTHQDEDEIQSPRGSIASFLVARFQEAFGDEPIEVNAPWAKAIDRAKHKLPAHLDPVQLQERVRWIQGLFLYVGDRKIFGDGWESMPSLADWKKEQKLAKAWPHLQAYWLMHHLVLDNRDELPGLLAIAERRYPAVKELAEWAEAVLAGRKVKNKVWNEARIAGFRMTAAEERPDALTKRGAPKAAGKTADPRAALKGDANAKKVLGLFELGESFAGNVPGLEEGLGKHANSDIQIRNFMWSRRGNATMLRAYMWILTEHVDKRFQALFEPIVRAGAKLDEAHKTNVPGALAGLGVAMGDWDAYVELVRKLIGNPAKLGRLRRLEIAVVAQRILEKSKSAAAVEFLRGEAARFAKQIDDFQVDTASTALAFLLRRRDPKAFPLFNAMFERAKYSGANWTTLLAFISVALQEVPDKKLLPGLRAAAKRSLGRHDDGDRALVWRALAASGEDAKKIVALARSAKDDVRTECARAAVVAGLLQAEGAKHAKEAKDVLAKLLAEKGGSMQNGAAISMLQAAHAKGVKGFGKAVDTLLAAAKRDKHTKKSLVAWLKENARSLA